MGERTKRAWIRPLLAGGAVGAVLFLAEGALVLRSNAVGLKMDVRGPLAALLAAVRPLLPSLLGRILLAYLVIGAGLGLAAWALAGCVAKGRRRGWLWGVELLALLGLACVARAIERPALFDDLPFGRGALALLVDHAAPWEAWLALALFVGAHVGIWISAAPRARGRFAASVAVLLGALAILWRLPAPAGEAKPLVVLFGIDAFRPDRVEGSGRHVAPHVERFLKDATRFTQAYTPIAQTEPAWRAIVTARWPSRTGVRFPLTPHADWTPLPTFPGELAARGVQTTFATDCSRFNYLGAESGFAQRVEPPRGALNFLLEKLRFRLVGVFLDSRLGSALLPELIDNRALAGLYDPLAYAHRLSDRLEGQAARGPTFFAFHDTAAHFPGDPVYPFYRRYVPGSEPLERRLRMIFAPISSGSGQGGWTREGEEALYDELIAQADAQLGVVLDALKASGRYDDAWVIVFSDHGESFYADHPELQGATPEHGARLGPEENRILLAVKPPKAFGEPPATVDALVRLIDVGPTILDALHAPPLENADGQSVLGLLRGAPEPPRWLYAETGYTHATPDVFDPDHFSSGPRGFDAYEVLPDGAVQMTAKASAGALGEKDVGAFDGSGWLIQSPQADGGTKERCDGVCTPALAAFLERNR